MIISLAFRRKLQVVWYCHSLYFLNIMPLYFGMLHHDLLCDAMVCKLYNAMLVLPHFD